jgi:hypothetical protein
MIVQQTDRYIKACMQAWLFCESCIHSEMTTPSPRQNLIKQCHDCAQACFAVVCRLVSNQTDVHQLAINCILQCRQCQQECEKYETDDIMYCAEVCANCADKMKDIAIPFCLN